MILAEKETDITALMIAVTEEAEASLNRTPELLPVLKEVGVVDSGGKVCSVCMKVSLLH